MTEKVQAKARDSYAICGAKNRAGKPCRRPAGWGTDHAGEGKCKLHGGRNRIIHGRYSKYAHRRLATIIEDIENTGADPMDMTQDLLTMRALFQDYLNRTGGKNGARYDASVARELVSEATKIVKRIEDVAAQNAVSYRDFRRVLTEMGRVVADVVENPRWREMIDDGWRSIRLT